MNAVGMGAVYERTTGLEILRTPTDAERAGLIATYYTPYAEAIAQLVRDLLAANGRVTIVDVHSYPKATLPYELHGDGPRPEVCVGTDAFHTPPSSSVRHWRPCARSRGTTATWRSTRRSPAATRRWTGTRPTPGFGR